jgi:hypothetical protein
MQRVVVEATAARSRDAAAASRALTWPFDCSSAATPARGRSIGHTSVVFKVELSSGAKAAWKPNARKVKERWRGEVAAYRLAQALGLDNVPPACARTLDAETARAALAGRADATRLFDEQAVVEGGKVRGVIIPWIDGLRFWPLEKEPLRSEVRGWLASSEIPVDERELARQASDLVAFDFVTGNWDRYSGENVGLDAAGARVLFIDNDAAFMARPPPDQLAQNRARLEATMRFSRGLVDAARLLDRERLAAAIGDEEPGRPLLPGEVLTSVAERLAELVGHVDAKIGAHGEAATLAFP